MFSRYAAVAVIGLATTVVGVEAKEGRENVGSARWFRQDDYDFVSNKKTPNSLLMVLSSEDDEVYLGVDFISKSFAIMNDSDDSNFGKSTKLERVSSVTIRTTWMDNPVTLKMKKDGWYTFVSSPEDWELYLKEILTCENFGVKIGDDTHIFNMNQRSVRDAWHVYAMHNE
jgi:hypothetical protein